jgi:arylsulfatase
MKQLSNYLLGICFVVAWIAQLQAKGIVHDAEYYVVEAQHGERWAAEDKELDALLAKLHKKHGRPPNLIHIMWDDTAFGDVGIPSIQKVRGLNTPNLNRMAAEGVIFTRM